MGHQQYPRYSRCPSRRATFFLVPVSLHRMGMVFFCFVLLGGERTELGFISWFDLCKYCPS